MLVVIHILVAMSGLACSAAALIAPSKSKIRATFGLVVLTVISGTLLIISSHAPLLQSCITGLLFVGIISAGAIAGQRRLALQVSKSKDR